MLRFPAPAVQLFRLALPVFGELGLQNLLTMVDALFVAQLGLLAMNAVKLTGFYGVIFLSVCSALGVTVTIYLSRAAGGDDWAKGKEIVWQGLLLGVGVGMLVACMSILFASPLLQLAGAQAELIRVAKPYFWFVLGSTPLLAVNTILAACFRARGDTRTPLQIGLLANGVHVLFDWFLIFGIGPFSGLGLVGAGLAYLLAQMVSLWQYGQKAARLPRQIGLLPARRELRVSPAILRSMLAFAIPAVAERLFKRGGQVIYLSFVVRMGTEAFAAHNIVDNLAVFSALLGDGLATAVSISTGQAIGESQQGQHSRDQHMPHLHDRITEFRTWGFRGAAGSMTVCTALLCALSPWVGRWFTDQPTVLHMITLCLALHILCQPFFAANLIDAAAIQATGNSVYTMCVTLFGVWGVRFLGIAVFAYYLGGGLPIVWVCIALDHLGRAYLYRRYRKNILGSLPPSAPNGQTRYLSLPSQALFAETTVPARASSPASCSTPRRPTR